MPLNWFVTASSNTGRRSDPLNRRDMERIAYMVEKKTALHPMGGEPVSHACVVAGSDLMLDGFAQRDETCVVASSHGQNHVAGLRGTEVRGLVDFRLNNARWTRSPHYR